MNGAFNAPPDIGTAVAEQAVSWLVEMQGGALSPRRQQAWEQWLHAHAEHQRAWEHIQRIYELCDRNVSETARRLNMHRRTLQRILAKRAPR